MERTPRRYGCSVRQLLPLLMLVLALPMSAQVNSSQFKDFKAFTTATEKGKPGKYKAQKVKGKISGMGALLYKNGSMYYGDFFDKELQGPGTFITTDTISYCPGAVVYVGRFKNGVKNGKGRCYNAEGELIYEGRFKDDMPVDAFPNIDSASGAIQYFTEIETDDCRFFGEFSGDNPNGPGLYAFNNGDLYISSFKDGEQDGLGVYIQSTGDWMLEKVEKGVVTPISSSSEYESLRKTAKANFRESLSETLGYFAAAAQKGGELASQIHSMSHKNSGISVDAGGGSYGGSSSGGLSSGGSSSGSTSGSKYNLSEQQSYNRDKSTYNKYDSMLSKYFAGNSSASQSEKEDWQSKMRQLRQKWESKGKNFPHSANEDR